MFSGIRLFLLFAICPTIAWGQLRITEFMAANTRTLADEDGAFEDWIEIHNASANTVNLQDWCLTDSATNLTQWRFPATNLTAGAYLVVFSSNKDRRLPGHQLHTNFKLSVSGEYLALVHPDGVTIATEFAPAFPSQAADVSYGIGMLTSNVTLIAAGAPSRVLVPSEANGGDTLAFSWTGAATNEPFADGTWHGAITGLGFSAGANMVGSTSLVVRFNFDSAPVAGVVVDSKPSGAIHNGVNKGAVWVAASTDASPTPVARGGLMQFDANSGNQITLAPHADFNASKGTIMFWMRTTGATGPGSYGPILFDRRAHGYTGPGDVIVMQDDGRIFVQAGNGVTGGVNQFATPNTVNDNRWHHIAYVYDQAAAGSIEVYIDGTLCRQQNNSAAWSWSATQEIELGRSYDAFWRRFNGLMDDFRIYNRQLTAAEITQVIAGDGGVAPSDIGTNLQADMLGQCASAFIRVPFVVSNPSDYSLLTLRLKYDDGFVAWLNGQEISRENAPRDLAWNSAASGLHSSSVSETITIGNPAVVLRPGTNILAIQGLNASANDSTFLMLPELAATSFGRETATGVYFTSPTPGAPNSGGAATPGPAILNATHSPAVPLDTEDLLVTARLEPTFNAVSNVTLRYRVMFNNEITVPMFDDGAHGDGAAGDGMFGASIPASAATNGQMIRYYITATDIHTNVSRWPLFTDPASTAECLGTVVNPDTVASQLPVFHLFIASANLPGVDSESGSRVSFFYDGEFYDNVYMELRGNTTAGYPKKSHRLEFNREHPLRHPGAGGRVRKTSLMAEFIDPSYVRQFLSFWMLDQAGHNAPFHYPVRVQRNGQFYQLAYHSESLGEEQLARFGFDPNGALYKAVGVLAVSPCSTGGGPEKRTREFELGMADYTALASAIANTAPLAQRRTNLFDVVDVPALINYLAVSRLTHEQDDIWANLSIYRDSDGDRMWRVIPFDMNLSWGQLYGSSTIQAANDSGVSHPFYGASTVQIGGACGGFNHLFDAVVQLPETRQMFLRRLRSVMDQFLQPPGTLASAGVLENKIYSMTNGLWAEAILDRQTWGWASGGGGPGALPPAYLTNGVANLINQFINPRRVHLYRTHSITNAARSIGLTLSSNAGIPLTQAPDADLAIASVEFNPSSGIQAQEYVCVTNANAFALDISGWVLGGAIRFAFKPGTVLPSNGVAYVSPDLNAFRARSNGPRGGQGLLVLGPYQGQLSARGETLTISDDHGRLVQEFSYPGNPTVAQQFLRVTEIMYHPAPLAGNTNSAEQFEYVELRNISTNLTLNLAGVHFTNGIEFNFTGSAVTSLAPGARVLVVKDVAAFTTRYGSGLPVAGAYAGNLDNSGESLRLDDAVGEKILEFAYDNSWYPLTDGMGYSLVIVDDSAPWFTWGDQASWRASAELNGSPGIGEPAASSLRFDSISPGVMLTFQAFSNTTYTIQFAEQLGTSWFKLIDVPARLTNRTEQISDPANSSRRYYRLATPRQP